MKFISILRRIKDSHSCQNYVQPAFLFVVGLVYGHLIIWIQTHSSRHPRSVICNATGSIYQQRESYHVTAQRENTTNYFIFIGIMSSRKFLESRAFACNHTWVSRVPGKVVFFIGEGEKYKGELTVIQLPGIKDNEYPPQKKSFAMVEYMAKHFAKDYEWLMRADDDLYIRVDKLVQFLKSINSTVPRYIGQASFGPLFLEDKLGLSGTTCMGGPGIVMTRSVVLGVAPHLRRCLNDTVTSHEDSELARCITNSTGAQCILNVQMKEIFHHTYNSTTREKPIGRDELRAITLHPYKDAANMFALHNYFNKAHLTRMQERTSALLREILNITFSNETLPGKAAARLARASSSISRQEEPDNSLNEAVERQRVNPVNLERIQLLPNTSSMFNTLHKTWEMLNYRTRFSTTIDAGKLSLPNELQGRKTLLREISNYLKSFREFSQPSAYLHEFTYQRLTLHRGVETIVYLDTKNKYHQPIYVRKPLKKDIVEFREPEVKGEEEDATKKSIYVLMTLYQRSHAYERFLQIYSRATKEYKGKVFLRVAIFPDDVGEHKNNSRNTLLMVKSNPDLDIQIFHLNGRFDKVKGHMTTLAGVTNDSVVLFMDVDMEFSTLFLRRVSTNTVLGKSAFFPICFSHFATSSVCYKTSNCQQILNSRGDSVGMWRSFGYGIASVYKKDYLRAGGFRTDIKGWGIEDIDFFQKCVGIGLQVMRAPDPSLVHRFHDKTCDSSLPENQKVSCHGSAAAVMGSVKNLHRILTDFSDLDVT